MEGFYFHIWWLIICFHAGTLIVCKCLATGHERPPLSCCRHLSFLLSTGGHHRESSRRQSERTENCWTPPPSVLNLEKINRRHISIAFFFFNYFFLFFSLQQDLQLILLSLSSELATYVYFCLFVLDSAPAGSEKPRSCSFAEPDRVQAWHLSLQRQTDRKKRKCRSKD